MDNSSFIKLDRNILKWEWYHDANTTRMFIHLLLKANWKDTKYCGIDVPRGSLVTTYPMLSEETGLTVRQARTALSHLKSTGEVTVNRQAKFSVITISNYDRYQSNVSQDDSQVTVNRQSSDSLGEKEREEKESTREKEDIEKDIRRSKEEKNIYSNNSTDSNIYINNNKDINSNILFAPDDKSPCAGKFLLNDGSYFQITENDIETYQELYPAVDVRQELRNIEGWCLSNPQKRKTRRGAKRFLNSWLARKQDQGGTKNKNSDEERIQRWLNE